MLSHLNISTFNLNVHCKFLIIFIKFKYNLPSNELKISKDWKIWTLRRRELKLMVICVGSEILFWIAMQENKNLIRDSIKHVSVYIILCAAHLTPRQHRKCWTRPPAAALAAPFVNFAKLREREIRRVPATRHRPPHRRCCCCCRLLSCCGSALELATNLREVSQCREKAPNRAISLFKVPTSADTIKNEEDTMLNRGGLGYLFMITKPPVSYDLYKQVYHICETLQRFIDSSTPRRRVGHNTPLIAVAVVLLLSLVLWRGDATLVISPEPGAPHTHTSKSVLYSLLNIFVWFYIFLRDAVMMIRRLVIILREKQIFFVTLYKIFSKFW